LKARLLAMLAVIALHLVFLLLIERLRVQSERTDDTSRALILVPLKERRVEQPRARNPSTERTREANESRPVRRVPQSAPPVSIPNPVLPDVPTPPRQIDWRANALRSAEVLVERSREEAYRSFGPRKEAAPDEAPAPSVFGPPPKHKRGDVDSIGGDPVVWINESCYMELDKRVQTARDWVLANPGQFAPPKAFCVGGGAAPNGELFEHIKKRAEPPVPKAGIEMQELPEAEARSAPSR
jgi:hypothetical protein